jgi:MerR family transcriptional regulator, light-induced transcriptional regulator
MPRRASPPEPGATSDPGLLSIGALSRATSIPVQTLRTWERRYQSPQPARKPSGHRLYPASLVGRLRKVAQLLDRGHRPAEILALDSAGLDALLSLSGVGANTSARVARPPLASAPATAGGDGPAFGELLQAVERFDRQGLMDILRASWIRLGPLQFLQQCAAGMMVEVGTAWRSGRLGIRHEHFATACLASFLREVRAPFDHQARGPRVIAAMLPGDAHEGGLLMASVILAVRGCRLVYLGVDMPVEQIATAAREGEVQAVALSISATFPPRQAGKAVANLRAALPRRMPLWVGGAGAPRPPKGVERFETLEALDERLATRR